MNAHHDRGLSLRYQAIGWLLMTLMMGFWPQHSHAQAVANRQFALQTPAALEISTNNQWFRASDDVFPAGLGEVAAWQAKLEPVDRVSLFGGAYWLLARIDHTTELGSWVLDPHGSLIDRVEMRLYHPDGRVDTLKTGYQTENDYMLHYGKDVQLAPNTQYQLIMRIESPYYARTVRLDIIPASDYSRDSLSNNLLTIGALGALLSLCIYNFFIFSITRERSQLFYALYLLTYCLAWGITFHIPSQLLGWRDLHWHYVGFFLLPVFNGFFCIEFLKLKDKFPVLYKSMVFSIVFSVILLPSCLFLLSYAHTLATLAISVWLALALVAGIISWRSGFQPARFFVVAFIALLIPGTIILPANFGLIPALVRNPELLTLLGGTLDGLLLAFALAERIRLLEREKDIYLQSREHALKMAHTDSMTGIGNRHAFDQLLRERFTPPPPDNQPLLVLVDLDGLKKINDKYGHRRGDDLLRSFAEALAKLETQVMTNTALGSIRVFRLGGDEFTIIATSSHEQMLRTALLDIETSLRSLGFAEAGVSYGIAYGLPHLSPSDVLTQADTKMYEHKTARKAGRDDANGGALHPA
jgi:diguanylate cyclase (GGDEF)-like protein